MEELKKYKQIVQNEINEFTKDVIQIKEEDIKIYELLKEYSLRGKLIRGSLILAVNEILTGEVNDNAIKVALAVELMHSSILVVDDIIDKDDIRRNKKSMHILTQDLIKNSVDLKHDAKSIAQCIALIGTYHSFNLISNLSCETKVISEEFIRTGLAELNEIIVQQKNDYDLNDIFSIYENKTARYTITLPIRLAYLISQKDFDKTIERITILLGIIFQLKDDILELEADSNDIGKSNLSDIKAGKKHYPRKLLEENLDDEDKKLFNEYNLNLNDDNAKKIKLLYDKYEIVHKTKNKINDLNKELDLLINEIKDNKLKSFLIKMKEYIYSRTY